MSIFGACSKCDPRVPIVRKCAPDRQCCRELVHFVLAGDPNVATHVAIHACKVNHTVVCSRDEKKACLSPFCTRRPSRTNPLTPAMLPTPSKATVCGLTLLQIAVLANDLTIAKILLQSGALPNKYHSAYESALVLAITKSSHEIIELLVEHGAVVDEAVMAQASSTGSIILMDRLLRSNPQAPLLQALIDVSSHPVADTTVVVYLLRHTTYAARSQFLFHCTCQGHLDLVRLIIKEFGPKIAIDYRGDQYAVGDTLIHTACRMHQLELLKYFIHIGVDINGRNGIGVSPLYICSATGALPFVEVLIRAHASVRGNCGPNGDSALHVAVQENHFQIARLLVHAQADINGTTGAGDTPLHIASMHGHIAMVAYLLRKGADVSKENLRGETALMKACQLDHASVVTMLERAHESTDFGVDDGRSSSFVYYDVMRHVKRVHSV
ncbi:serine/threonine-protein phosphatase 6 regulatory ankyrin repeat subunit C-like [Thraustotheca clavata]|uniref:Serine/threonine-protein phosphatase 6 regulatory ankyrin repeat subunit C-like n=1 Tax=Thraustotheca clavata TaxID=74557 RepID=A0A1V9Y718_9STRA|nr:serine/threonine-protein phosphatase 6 regulatory ankyrin repeat subunit C-like [Thraustotheca clavata]